MDRQRYATIKARIDKMAQQDYHPDCFREHILSRYPTMFTHPDYSMTISNKESYFASQAKTADDIVAIAERPDQLSTYWYSEITRRRMNALIRQRIDLEFEILEHNLRLLNDCKK